MIISYLQWKYLEIKFMTKHLMKLYLEEAQMIWRYAVEIFCLFCALVKSISHISAFESRRQPVTGMGCAGKSFSFQLRVSLKCTVLHSKRVDFEYVVLSAVYTD